MNSLNLDDNPELVRETLLDLERSRQRELASRLESEALLTGLSSLNFCAHPRDMWIGLLEALRPLLDFDAAVVLLPEGPEAMKPVVATSPTLFETRWHVGRFFSRVLQGQGTAVFDVTLIPEWAAQASSVTDQVRSAVHIPFFTREGPALLIFTHPARGFFAQRQVHLLQRFSPLASQILHSVTQRSAIAELNRFFTLSLEMMCIADFDGFFHQVNQAWLEATGQSASLNDSHSFFEAIFSEDLEGVLSQLILVQAGSERVHLEFRYRRQDGVWLWLSASVSACMEDRLYYVVAKDITKRKEMEEALRASEERYSLAARAANDGLWDWELDADVIYVSPRWKEMVGLAGEDKIAPEDWFARVFPEDLPPLRQAIAAHLEGSSPQLEVDYRVVTAEGVVRWLLIRGLVVRTAQGVATRIAGAQSDVTDRKQVERRLAHQALHDALTDLPNRLLFLDRLRERFETARVSTELVFAVLFLDLDRFKIINDSLGHGIGDLLLTSLASRLKRCVRENDTVARLGGDEFTILLAQLRGPWEAELIAERIRQALEAPFQLQEHSVVVSASIGITLGPHPYERADDLLRDADTAMYRAKADGKARHQLFSAQMHSDALARLELEARLRGALDQHEIVAHFQPVINLQSGQIEGFEALARWFEPSQGTISPARFIPIAEETGLIVRLGVQVLEQAIAAITSWRTSFEWLSSAYVAVNISTHQLVAGNLVAEVIRLLSVYDLPAQALRLEITESLLIEHSDSVKVILNELRTLGLGMSLDDFGTGYSSLSHLLNFPVDHLKIDRSFVSQLMQEGSEAALIKGIIALGRSLGLTIIAEGVEEPEQHSMLLGLGCSCGQGHHYSPPLSEEKVLTYLNDQADLARGYLT